MTHHAFRLLVLSSILLGCDGAPASDDAGPTAVDSGTLEDAGASDAGADAGFDAAIEIGEHSLVTLVLPSGPVTFPSLDGDGRGVVVTGGFGTDAGELFLIADDQLFPFDPATRRLGTPMPLLDDARAANVAPDHAFSGVIGEEEFLLALEGSDLLRWDPAPTDSGAPRFGPPLALRQRDDPGAIADRPYAPVGLEIVFFGASVIPVGISEDRLSFMIETAPASFVFFPAALIQTCSEAAAVEADFLTVAVPPGAPGGTASSLIVVSGNLWHRVEGVCLEEGVPLLDESGAPIAEPTVVFGANFDASADGSEEVLVVVQDAP